MKGLFAALLTLVSAAPALGQSSYVITTIAGGSNPYFYPGTGDGGPATSAGLAGPVYDITLDSSKNLYILAGNLIRKVTPSGNISTVAGGGASVGDFVPATQAQLAPLALVSDPKGNLYIADTAFGISRIRKVDTKGIITTIAGGAPCCDLGDGGPATSAYLSIPLGLALDSTGNLYVAQANGQQNVVRKIGTDGSINTVAGGGASGDGGQATSASLAQPSGVAVDSQGNLYIAEAQGNRIRQVSPDGTINTIAGSGAPTTSGDGGPAVQAGINSPWRVAVDSAGHLFISQINDARIRLVSQDGTVSTLAGTGTNGSSGDSGPASAATVDNPAGIAIGPAGQIYIAQASATAGRIRLLAPGPLTISPPTIPTAIVGQAYSVTLVATGGSPPYTWSPASGALPKALTLSPSGVISGVPTATGAFNASARVSDASTPLQTATLPLNIAVSPATAPLNVTPSQLILTAAQGANATAVLQADGGPGQSVSIAADQSWLVVNPTQGTPSFQTNVTASTSGLTPGNYSGNVIFGGSLKVPVAFTVTAPAGPPHLVTNTLAAGLQFQLYVGYPIPNAQTISITSSDGSALNYTANVTYPSGSTGQWVNLSARRGQTTGSLDVGVQITALGQPANYTAQLVLSTPGAPDVQIPLTLLYSQPSASKVQVDVQSFRIASVGDVQKRALIVTNSGPGALPFTAGAQTDDGTSWLTVTPPSASTADQQPAVLQVSADPTAKAAGTYTGSIQVQSGTQTPVSIPVIFAVASARSKMLYTADTALNLSIGSNYTSLPPQPLELVASGSGPVNWSAQANVPWITLTPSSGQVAPNTVASSQVSFDLKQLLPGDNKGVITIASDSAGGPLTVPVDVQVLPAGTAVLFVQPTGMAFVAPALDARQVLFIASTNGPIVASANQPWLTAQEVAGAAGPPAHTVNVAINPGLLPPGIAENRGTVTVQDAAGNSRTISILVYVPSAASGSSAAGAKAVAGCKPSKLLSLYTSLLPLFEQQGGAATSTEIVMIDDCGNPVSSGVTGGVLSNRDPQLHLRPLGNGIWKTTWHPVTPTPFVTIRAIGADPANGINPNVPVQALSSVVGAPTGPTLAPVNPFQTTAGVILPVMTPGMQVQLNGQNFVGSDGSAPTITLGGEPVQVVSVTGTQVVMVTPPDLSVNVESQLVVTTGDGVGVPEPVIVAPEWPSVVGLAGDRTVLLTGLGRSARLSEVEGVKVVSMEKLPHGVWRVELESPLGKVPAGRHLVVR